MKKIIALNSEKEELERTFRKKEDELTTELETLKGEFKVRMMKVQLQELSLDNALKEVEEKEEENATKFADKLAELKKLSTQAIKDKKLIETLVWRKNELQKEVEQLTK